MGREAWHAAVHGLENIKDIAHSSLSNIMFYYDFHASNRCVLEVLSHLYKRRKSNFSPSVGHVKKGKIHMYAAHSFLKKKQKTKKLLSIYYLPGFEATLRIKQTAKTPCSHETCNSVGKKKMLNIMKKKDMALWVWTKRETNMNKFIK